MKIVRYVVDLLPRLSRQSLGLVPTMGALHEGHLSLVSKSILQNDVTVCSIFVNPSQFDATEDFENYPKTLENDLRKLSKIGCDIVFVPDESEVKSSGYEENSWHLGHLEGRMEGVRKGHFQGVANIVCYLFKLIKPTRAYFGEKDFQQISVVRRVVDSMGLPVEIISCETKRTRGGLALSSRNLRLSKKAKVDASNIHKALLFSARAFGDRISIAKIQSEVIRIFLKPYGIDLEYLTFLHEETLTPIETKYECQNIRICIAVYLEGVRLIDNTPIN